MLHSTLFATVVLMLFVACTKDQPSVRIAGSFQALPVLRTVGKFSGTTQHGKPLTSASLRGHIWLGSFFFTRCESICPALNIVQTGLQRDFGDRIKFVSISSDPDFDTPSVMMEYAQRFGAKDGVWWMLNIPHNQMAELASNGLGLVPPASPDMHSTRFVLVDSVMNVRGYFDSADTNDVLKLRSLLDELQL